MAKKKTATQRRNEAKRLLSQVVRISPDEGTKLRAKQIHDRLTLPMTTVLGNVPGLTVAAKCKKIGVSRQAYYYWIRGMSRPNATQARRIARLTGLAADDIRGRTKLTLLRTRTLTRRVPSRRVKRNGNNLPATPGT